MSLLNLCLAWDTSIKKKIPDQYVYTESKRSISLKDLVFSNTEGDTTRVFTSGLVDYIVNYTLSNSKIDAKSYKEEVTNLKYPTRNETGCIYRSKQR